MTTNRHRWLLAITAAAGWLGGNLSGAGPHPAPKEGPGMKLTSTAFMDGQPIPAKYTCDGVNVSPPLQWSGPPRGTVSFALICDDPDAPVGTWVHWVLYGLPSITRDLPEMTAPTDPLPAGAQSGMNDFRRVGYGGPCPPPGRPHRYFFRLYALDTALLLQPRATRQQVLHAIAGHILAEARLMGTYQRGQ